MDREDEQKILRIFESALDGPPLERAAFVERSLGDHPDLRDSVESLLAAQQDAAEFLSRPALDRLLTRSLDASSAAEWPASLENWPSGTVSPPLAVPDTIPGYRLLEERRRFGLDRLR